MHKTTHTLSILWRYTFMYEVKDYLQIPLNFPKKLTRQTFQNQNRFFPRTTTAITITFHAKLVNIKTILLLKIPPLTITQNGQL